jgi:hypothetical protein
VQSKYSPSRTSLINLCSKQFCLGLFSVSHSFLRLDQEWY